MKLFARASNKKGRRKFRIGWKLALLALPLAAFFAVLTFYAVWAQTFDMKKVGDMPERNTVFDVDGKIYSRLAGANRLKVALNEVSPFFVDAVIAREDTRFFEHGGIDWRGIARALIKDILSASAKEGASSLTQQLARNSLPLGGRTLSRKILEAMVALRIERDFTKQQIIELYINRIYFGSGCYGVQTASMAYFGKDAAKLNLSEAAVLAGLIRSPNRFSPLKNPEGAALQRNTVLDRMLELKKITAAQAEQAKLAKVTSNPKRLPQVQENYAMDAVQRDLNLLLTPDQIDNGGLFIYTTLDPTVQATATQALETQLGKIEHQSNFHHPTKASYRPPDEGEDSSMPYLQGALVAIDNTSGGIRALVGGRDYAQSKFNRALAPANRQVGSAFKPFVYTLAFTHGLLPGAAISDGPIEPGEIEGAGNWAPGNSDGTYGGIQPVSYGLIHSRNTMSVRVGQFAGLDDVQKDRDHGRSRRKHPARAGDFHRLVRNESERFDLGLHDFSERGHSQAGLHHRADRRRGSQPDLSRGARGHSRARSRRRLDDFAIDGGSPDQRNGGEREVARLQTPGRGQDRDDERLQRRLVCRLHDRADVRRLGRVRSAEDDHPARLRRGPRVAGLDASDDESGAALSRAGARADNAAIESGGLFHLESSRDDWLQRGRNGLRNHVAG